MESVVNMFSSPEQILNDGKRLSDICSGELNILTSPEQISNKLLL
jgi:hypothetical protein